MQTKSSEKSGSTMVGPAMTKTEVMIVNETRKSIKKHMSLGVVMKSGSSNPLTVHDADPHLFRAVWCLLAEIMLVGGELDRVDKEDIATMISRKNMCSICVTAHVMMATAARKRRSSSAEGDGKAGDDSEGGTITDDEERSRQAVKYAELVLQASQEDIPLVIDEKDQAKYSLLNSKARAECAMIVLLFQHLNRVISAILGDSMTALVGIKRSEQTVLEKPTVMQFVNQMMKPIIASGVNKKNEPGFTEVLFKSSERDERNPQIPSHLQPFMSAGKERAVAVARCNALVDTLYDRYLSGLVTNEVIDIVDTEVRNGSGDSISPVMILSYVTKKAAALPNREQRVVATIMLLVAFFPKRIFQSKQWKELIDVTGSEKLARLVVTWSSLRLTMKQAKVMELDFKTEELEL